MVHLVHVVHLVHFCQNMGAVDHMDHMDQTFQDAPHGIRDSVRLHEPAVSVGGGALREARRVLRPGGLLFAAAISRFAALLDLLVNHDRLHEPEISHLVEESVRTGVFNGPGEAELFTTGYFHLPGQLFEAFNLEGPGFLVADLESRWRDPDRREAL